MAKKTQSLWRKNFDIRRADYCLPIETAPGFGGLSFLTNGKNSISKFIWVVENLDCKGTYFLKHELREIVELTKQAILTNPKKVDQVHRQATQLNWDYYKLALKLRKLPFSKLSNKQLLAWQKKLFNIQFLSHVWALPTTWFLDSDGEDFSKHMTDFLYSRIQKLNLDIEPATAFSVLSSPKDESFSAQEEKASLKILTWINQTASLRLWFVSQKDNQLVLNLQQLPKDWIKKIEKHHYDFCWLPYTYIGPAYGLDYYLETWKGLLQENFDPEKRLAELETRAETVQKHKKILVKQLKLTQLEQHWFKIASDIVWLKGFRKETFFHGFYAMDQLLKEVGRRSGLSTLQTKYLLPSELPKALAGKDYSSIVNERQRFSVIYGQTPKNYRALTKSWTEKGIQVFTGKKAKAFLKKQNFEKIRVIQTNELAGTCACPGKAQGIIKIINVPDEMIKMNKGDIMLSHTTFPSLVPAMKKAAAIITEDGGITCHAAIVARELQTPCVVGCKHALQILKDGDMVEIDATKGTIKKL